MTGLGVIVVMLDGEDDARDNGGWSGIGDGKGERNRVGLKGSLGPCRLVGVMPAGKPSKKWESVERLGGSEGWAAKPDRCHVGEAVL